MSEAGDFVKIRTSKKELNGTLLESVNPKIILLKLESGYNIGIEKEDIVSMRTLKKEKKEKSVKKIKQNPKLPKIGIISTGGTISSRLDYKTGGVTWLTDAEELLYFYPELLDIVNIKNGGTISMI